MGDSYITTTSTVVLEKKLATSEPYPVCSNHNSLQDRNNEIKGIIMRLSKRSGTNSPTNFQSPIIPCLGIDNVWIRFANEGDHIPRNYGCRIWRHGSGNLSHEPINLKYVVISRSLVNQIHKLLRSGGNYLDQNYIETLARQRGMPIGMIMDCDLNSEPRRLAGEG
jgi:hypothetical protein